MRICKHCQSDMIEGFDIKVEGGAYGIVIAKSDAVFAKRLGKPNVAICPKCGELSLYIPDIDKLDLDDKNKKLEYL